MPSYYKIFNCFPSFIPTFEQDGVERANPLPNYGLLGDHLQDYCENRMSETPAGGYGNLVAFLASEASLTGINQSSLTGMANHLSVAFGITTGTQGYALLDFRGDSWKYIIGDGILGPSNTTNSTAHTSTKTSAIAILSHFNSQYPNIKWAFAGLPNLPQFTTYAPATGSSPAWSSGLTNNGGANNHWDPSHPTGASFGDRFFNWQFTPSDLKSFYETQAASRSQTILDASGWACPDINPTISDTSPFGVSMYSVVAKNIHTTSVVSLAANYTEEQVRQFRVMPLVNSIHRSRESNVFDSPTGNYTSIGYAEGASGEVAAIYSGFSGGSSFAADSLVSIPTLKVGMLEPAANAGAVGFVYQDTIPMMIALACTGGTQSDDRLTQAVARARNFIARTVYGAYDTSLIPWVTISNELKSHFSYEVTAYQLRAISESIPVGEPSWQNQFVSEDPKISSGPSSIIPNYDTQTWETDLPFSDPSSFGAPVNCCPDPIGSCCVNKETCTDITQADCIVAGGAWNSRLCADLDPPCEPPPLVDCCDPLLGCVTNGTAAECAAAGGVEGCGPCCGFDFLGCICVRICTTPCDSDGDGTNDSIRTCKQYDLNPDKCCVCDNNPLTAPPSFCSGVATALGCGSVSACINCANKVLVTSELQNCCFFDCTETQFQGLGCFLPCGCDFSQACEPITAFMQSSTHTDAEKASVMDDLFNIFGVSFSKIQPQGTQQSTALRKPKRVADSFATFAAQGSEITAAHLNLVNNYTPTATTVARIQSEFAFNRFFLPNAYS